MKRGVSPLISMVLLIGFVILLAIILFLWLSGFFQDLTTGDMPVLVDFEIINAEYDSTLRLLVENRDSKYIIKSFKVEVIDANGEMQLFDSEKRLASFESGWVDVAGYNSGCPLKVTLYPFLEKFETRSFRETENIDCDFGGDCKLSEGYWADEFFDPLTEENNNFKIEDEVKMYAKGEGCGGARLTYIVEEINKGWFYSGLMNYPNYDWEIGSYVKSGDYKLILRTPGSEVESENYISVVNSGAICEIDEVYFSYEAGVDPGEYDISVKGGEDIAYLNVETDNCKDRNLNLRFDIYECEGESCVKFVYPLDLGVIGSNIESEGWIPPADPGKKYWFEAVIENEYKDGSKNYLFTYPEGFVGYCDFTLKEDQNIERDLEPIILTFAAISEYCPDIKYAKESNVFVWEGVELVTQIDDWNEDMDGRDEDNMFDENDEVLFTADSGGLETKSYTLKYNFIEEKPRIYTNTYNENTDEFWYGEDRLGKGKVGYFGKFTEEGYLISRQLHSSSGNSRIADNSYYFFLGSREDIEILMNGPVRARLYSEDEGNKGADFKANVNYDIYPDREAFITSNIEWLSNCDIPNIDNCFYAKFSVFQTDFTASPSYPVCYEYDENYGHAPWVNPGTGNFPSQLPEYTSYFKGNEKKDSAWFNIATVILSQEQGYFTDHFFEVQPDFDNIWQYRDCAQHYSQCGKDVDRVTFKHNTNIISGLKKQIDFWIANDPISRSDAWNCLGTSGVFYSRELAYENPLKIEFESNT